MLADINTKALQGSLFYKIRGRLMGIDEDYDDGFERLNTHQNLLPSQECAYRVSDKDASVLAAIVKVLKVSHNALPNATNKNQAPVADLLFTRTMARQN